jgi:hypothetical protein
MSGIEQLLTVARRYAEIEQIPLSTVSSRALNDGKKLAALESGSDITVGRLEMALRWFSDNWPDGEWPSDVPRPVGCLDGVRA